MRSIALSESYGVDIVLVIVVRGPPNAPYSTPECSKAAGSAIGLDIGAGSIGKRLDSWGLGRALRIDV